MRRLSYAAPRVGVVRRLSRSISGAGSAAGELGRVWICVGWKVGGIAPLER